MKSPRILIVALLQMSGIYIAMLLVIGFAVVVGISLVTGFQNRDMVYANSEIGSDFLKNYTPREMVERFQAKGSNLGWEGSMGGGAGHGFLTHSGGFTGTFAIQSQECVPLMAALDDHLAAELVRDGAQILSRGGDPREGFHYEYKLGRNVGLVTISPLHLDREWNGRIPDGAAIADLDIGLMERSFTENPGSTSASIGEIVRTIKAARREPRDEREALTCSLSSDPAR